MKQVEEATILFSIYRGLPYAKDLRAEDLDTLKPILLVRQDCYSSFIGQGVEAQEGLRTCLNLTDKERGRIHLKLMANLLHSKWDNARNSVRSSHLRRPQGCMLACELGQLQSQGFDAQ